MNETFGALHETVEFPTEHVQDHGPLPENVSVLRLLFEPHRRLVEGAELTLIPFAIPQLAIYWIGVPPRSLAWASQALICPFAVSNIAPNVDSACGNSVVCTVLVSILLCMALCPLPSRFTVPLSAVNS